MAEENKELPVVEEPKQPVKEPVKVEEVDSLVAELEKAGVSNTQQLQKKLEASSQSGRLAQLLGDERKRSEALEEKINQILSTRETPAMDDFSEKPIDIESIVAKSVNRVLDSRDQKARKIQEAQIASWQTIQGDEDYPLVRELWEEKLKDPNLVFKIQSGQTNPLDEYTSTLRQFYKGMIKKSADTIKTLKGGTIAPPHTESGGRTSANLVSEQKGTDRDKKIGVLREKVRKQGVLNPEDELDLVDLLPNLSGR